MKKTWLFLGCIAAFFFTWSCNRVSLPPLFFTPKAQSIDNLKVPPGFQISYFAKGVKNARAMCLGEMKKLFGEQGVEKT